jgi:hypothetical protein
MEVLEHSDLRNVMADPNAIAQARGATPEPMNGIKLQHIMKLANMHAPASACSDRLVLYAVAAPFKSCM